MALEKQILNKIPTLIEQNIPAVKIERIIHPRVVKASKSVILELGIILRGYFNDLVLIGGWAPYFISQKNQKEGFEHVGSYFLFLTSTS